MTTHSIFLRISGALLALILLSACNVLTNIPAMTPTPTPPATAEATANPTATSAPSQTPAVNAVENTPSITMDVNGVVKEASTQVVAAVASGENVAWFDVMPQYTLLTLQGYPITDHLKQPQIFIYPVKDLGVNKNAANNAEDLRTLLQTQQAGDQLPYLPLEFSVKQAILAQVKYLDFKNGKGVRFLTEWHNGLAPIDNPGLIYTYQGLTGDGKYYLAAVLPVNLQGLPIPENDSDFQNNYSQYLADTTSLLEQNPAGAFTPDLSKLDAMMQSIEIK